MSDTPTESTGHSSGRHEPTVDQRTQGSVGAEQPSAGDAHVESEGGDQQSGGEASDAVAVEVKALREELARRDDEIARLKDGLLRAHAEFDNAEKRLAREVENARKYALERFVEALLPVVDSLELGIAASNEPDADIGKLREGNEMTLRLFRQALERFQVEVVDPQGERFDPDRHEAMSAQPSDEHPPNTVISVMQKGYLLNKRLVRPALVMVSKPSSGGA